MNTLEPIPKSTRKHQVGPVDETLASTLEPFIRAFRAQRPVTICQQLPPWESPSALPLVMIADVGAETRTIKVTMAA